MSASNVRDELGLEWINAYITVYIDIWGCRLDQEDGHTAPFSSIAAQEADGVAQEWGDTLRVLTE